jgi:hypothetical protein
MYRNSLDLIKDCYKDELSDLDILNGIESITGLNERKLKLLLSDVESHIITRTEHLEASITQVQIDEKIQELKKRNKSIPMIREQNPLYQYITLKTEIHERMESEGRNIPDSAKKHHISLEGVDEYTEKLDLRRLFFPFALLGLRRLEAEISRVINGLKERVETKSDALTVVQKVHLLYKIGENWEFFTELSPHKKGEIIANLIGASSDNIRKNYPVYPKINQRSKQNEMDEKMIDKLWSSMSK